MSDIAAATTDRLETQPPARPATASRGIRNVVALHYVRRGTMLATPPGVLLAVLVVTILIALVLQRFGLDSSDPGWADGARNNGGVVWGLVGFIGYLGVQSVATTFPFALALGATRRHFALGTLLSHLLQSCYVTAVATVLLLVEKATGHWFVDAYAFDSHILGGGRIEIFVPTVLLGTLTVLSVGGAFAAAWVRYGTRGPLIIAAAVVLVIVLALLALAPALGTIVANFELWWLAVLSTGLIVLAVLGEYGFLRSASVR